MDWVPAIVKCELTTANGTAFSFSTSSYFTPRCYNYGLGVLVLRKCSCVELDRG